MTVKEFYEWAKENNCEDAEVKIQHRDGGGFYSGYDDLGEYGLEYDKLNNCVEV